MSQTKVSILITVYNLAEYIPITLDSVFAQDYQNIEVVVSDDASTDESASIIASYHARYPDKLIPIYNKINQGITRNCNIAIAACTGDLVAMLDGDDLFLPNKISSQVKLFDDDPDVSLCYHAGEIFDSETGFTMYISNQNPSEDTNTAEDIIIKGGIPITSSVMFRRSKAPENGFDERLGSVNDWLFFIEVALRGKVVKLEGLYAKYRKHGKGASDRSLELLTQSLMTLDIVVENHPQMLHLPAICKKGKARYIAGEAFRQIPKNVELAKSLFYQARKFDSKNTKYQLASLLLSILPFPQYFGRIISNYKYLIKRYM
jgi:glycosyltransferase involved in cell wall biosynthesis